MVETHSYLIGDGERHVITFSAAAISDFQSVNYIRGDDIALHLVLSREEQLLIVNSCIAGVWQQQEAVGLAIDASSDVTLVLAFAPDQSRITLVEGRGLISHDFARSLTGQQVQLNAGPDVLVATGSSRPPRLAADGVIDIFGLLPGGDCVISGWSARHWGKTLTVDLKLHCPQAGFALKAEVLWYRRTDLAGAGLGFVLYFTPPPELEAMLPQLRGLDLEVEGWTQSLRPHAKTQFCDPGQLRSLKQDLLPRISAGAVEPFRRRLLLDVYEGEDTLASLPVPFHFEIDAAYGAPGLGCLLMGWMFDPTEQVRSLRIWAGKKASREDLRQRLLPIARPDLRSVFGADYDLADDRLGFAALALDVGAEPEALHLEVVLHSGETAYKPLGQVRPAGLGAIKRLLNDVHPSMDDLNANFDKVVGPAVQAFNRHRLQKAMTVDELRFGTPPAAPRTSIVVPLYGRLDFVEHQIAQFSRGGMAQDELIYVLDEPSRKGEVLAIAERCSAAYRLPLRIILPSESRGFGPASNLGLKHAAAERVCFLNSDIFPREAQWLDQLHHSLDGDPTIGVLGGLCLFADGSVQHLGISYQPVTAYAGWRFPKHPKKGMRPPEFSERLSEHAAITGACMLMSRDLARELGGFDPRFVIGDFEDADLCQRIRAKGLRCVVDHDVTLYHLERQSQGDQQAPWRMNLTLANAWLFNRRWSEL